MTKEVCSGGVVYHLSKGKKLKFLLLKHKNGNHWDLPKGHLESGESMSETALREVVEETGLTESNIKFINELKHKNSYSFVRNSQRIDKIVHLFLFESSSNIIYLSEEHSNYIWLTINQVKDKLTFQTSYPAFLEASSTIKSLVEKD